MKTMLDILNETIAAYTSETRAVDERGFCRLLTRGGRMCARGRCMIDPGEFYGGDFDQSLKPEYRGHPSAFWAYLQGLHDRACFWDEEGLSDDGAYHIEYLRQMALSSD